MDSHKNARRQRAAPNAPVDYGHVPATPLEAGIAHFAEWFQSYRRPART